MRVLVVGGGGREHALAYYLSQSPLCTDLYAAPGNPGIAELGECVAIPANNVPPLVALAKSERIDLVVVGPEAPLAGGLADWLRDDDIATFGPSAGAAQIETSKVFARRLGTREGVPQPAYCVCTSMAEVERTLCDHYSVDDQAGYVVKADGLAGGKGAFICDDAEAAIVASRNLLEQRSLGKAGERILIERRLRGEEASLFVLTDGKNAVPLLPAQDYKRAYDNDLGPNTGGMGAHAPAPVMTPALVEKAMETIIRPTLKGLANEGYPFQGCLYAGLMVLPPQYSEEPELALIEFNCRFGDPELQAILPLLDEDLLPLLLAVAKGNLEERPLRWKKACATTVVLASNGYPGQPVKDKPITGLEKADQLPDVTVFHAGTKMRNDLLYTNGGRVLNVTGVGSNFQQATNQAYIGVECIDFDGLQYRSDIAAKVIDMELPN